MVSKGIFSVLAITIIVLLLPGVLAFDRNQVVVNDVDSAIQRKRNFLLDELDAKQCRDNTPSVASLAPPSDVGNASRTPTLPVDPSEILVPEGLSSSGGSSDPQTLQNKLEASTVLVLGGDSTGTGFAVAENLILTNRHVVENTSGDIYITNRVLGGVVKAAVIAVSDGLKPGEPDFALLEFGDSKKLPPLALSNVSAKLQNVIAAGFPGVVLQSDSRFEQLIAGDGSAVPDLVFTLGEVMSKQSKPVGTIILHRASVSPGNSGGPLVDECSRVVGVNTYVKSEDDTGADRIQFALGVDMVSQFLKENNIAQFAISMEVCNVQ